MIMKGLRLALIIAVLPFFASAWGVLGHRITAQIADSYLQPNARKAIKAILGNESMAMAANWADFIKSDTNYKYLSNWHYVNLPENLSKTDLNTYLDKNPGANLYNKTNEMVALLKDGTSTKEKKLFALRMLIHLMGDMHQPMHTARKDDLGGNKIQVSWFGDRTNLHAVWDEKLVDFQQLSYTEYAKAINFASVADQGKINHGSFKDYIFESYQICNKIYADSIKPDARLSYQYNFTWVSTVNQQLLKGGIRLANVLNGIFSKT